MGLASLTMLDDKIITTQTASDEPFATLPDRAREFEPLRDLRVLDGDRLKKQRLKRQQELNDVEEGVCADKPGEEDSCKTQERQILHEPD